MKKTKLTKKQAKKLEKHARKLIKFLAENLHPHAKIIVECDKFEVIEVIFAKKIEQYILD